MFRLSQSCCRYESKTNAENEQIEQWLIRLTDHHWTWGFGICFLYLRNVKRIVSNHKRVYRIYRELELILRIKPRKPLVRDTPAALTVPGGINEVWSMDFMHNILDDGRAFQLINVLDDFSREARAIEIDFSLPSERVIRALDQLIQRRAGPSAIRCDSGPEYISQTTMQWAEDRGIHIDLSQPSKSQQNTNVDRFNRTLRYELLNRYHCASLAQVQGHATAWMWSCNNDRPHMGLGGMTPKQRLAMAT